MERNTTKRKPDLEAPGSKNVAWALLPRTRSSNCNLAILVQRFEPGGDFENHSHDLEQFFYITKGEFEMTIGGKTAVYGEGDCVAVKRNEPHAGRNIAKGVSELIGVDYWPADSQDRIGLD